MSRSAEQEVWEVETKWYKDWVETNIPDLSGKVAIVTGANSGIGFWVTFALASKGCEVILACRDIEKGAAARNAILEMHNEAKGRDDPLLDLRERKEVKIHAMLLDLMDFESVKAFCTEFTEQYDFLDYLVNNAGVMALPEEKSVDGFDIQMQTNHLGHFLLTKLLWQRLVESPGRSRVVQHSCMAHSVNNPKFDSDKYPHYGGGFNIFGRMLGNIYGYRPFDQWMRYGVTKLANLLFMRELQRKIDEKALTETIISVAAHGGLAATNLQISSQDHLPRNWKRNISKQGQSAADGSLPLLMAICGENIQNGDFVGPGGTRELTGPPQKTKTNGHSDNEEQAEDLWDYSEDCVKEAFNV